MFKNKSREIAEVSCRNKIKKSKGYYIGQTINYIALTLLGIVTFYPFWYCFIVSINEGFDTLKGGIVLFPRALTLDNYMKAFQNPLIYSSFLVSVLRTVLSVVLSCLLTALLAYALAQKDLPGRKFVMLMLFFTTLFSGGLIPSYILYRQIGLLNNFWVYVLPGIYNVFNMIILRTFFQTIPDSLKEAARIDGCKELGIFFRIIFPLSLPAMATVALFVGVSNWNDWFTGAYFCSRNREIYPAATVLYEIINSATFESTAQAGKANQINSALMELTAQTITPESLKMAFLVVLTTPILLVYPFLQKYFVKGVMVGSIKE